MAVLTGPFGEFSKAFKEKYNENKSDGKSGVGTVVGGFFAILILLTIAAGLWAACSWLGAWCWNIAVTPFGGPSLTWVQFGCGWIVLQVLFGAIKNFYQK